MNIRPLWERMSKTPLGRRLFSYAVGRSAPYTGTIGAQVEEVRTGYCRVVLRDRKAVRNHLNSLHAVALINLGELSTGLCVVYQLTPPSRGIVRELSMTYTKKARGRITAECEAVVPSDPGKHDLEVIGILRDESGDEVARARALWRLDIRE